MVKNLFNFIRSIALSINNVLDRSPRMEHSPVSISKIKNEIITTMRSVNNRAVEIFMVEYFLIIIAIISVPPPEAFSKNSNAAAIAGRIIAKHSSNIISSVRGWNIGNTFSKTFSKMEDRIVTYAVFVPKFFPRTANPTINKMKLINRFICAAVNGINLQITTAIPDTPPKEKLLGNLNR